MTSFEKSGYSAVLVFLKGPTPYGHNPVKFENNKVYFSNCSLAEGPKIINMSKSGVLLLEFSAIG